MTTPPGSDVAVILAVTPDDGEIVRVVEDWTAAGLLRTSLLVTDDVLNGPVPAFDELPVRRISPSGTVEEKLLDSIGTRTLRLVRFVAVRPVPAEPEPGGGDKLNEILEVIAPSLSYRTRLIRVNLVVPRGGPALPVPALLEPRWDVNVVVSAEDRPHDDAIDFKVTRAAAFPPHAALACATAGGLWEHQPAAPFDTADATRVAGNHRRIVVARSTVRLVDNRDLSERVINKVVRADTTALLDPELVDRGDRLVRSSARTVEAVATAFRQNIGEHPFDFHPLPEPEREPRRPRRTGSAVTRAFRQLVRRRTEAISVPTRDLTEPVVEWLTKSRPDITDQADSWNLTQLPPTPWRVHEIALSAPDLLPKRAPAPAFAWRPLRQMCFGLIDAGEQPDEVQAVVGGRRPVVSNARWIVPSPVETFEFKEEEIKALSAVGRRCGDVRATDLNASRHVRRRLAEAVGKAETTGDEPPETAQSRLAVLRACQARFVEWDDRERAQSLIGLLSEHVSKQLGIARKDLDRRAAQYNGTNTERRRLQGELNKSFAEVRKNRWVGPSAGVLSAAAVACALLFPLGVAGVVALLALIAAGWWGGRMAGYLAREVRLENELAAVEEQRRAIVAAVERWPTEADRLASVYDVLTDWGEIIGWMAHKPFGRGEEPETKLGLDTGQLPQAFQFSVADDDATVDRVIQHTLRDTFGRGWLMHLYVAVMERAMGGTLDAESTENNPDYAPAVVSPEDDPTATGPAGHAPASEPFGEYADVYQNSGAFNARTRLIGHFRASRCGAEARRMTSSRIREGIRRVPVTELAEKVTVHRDGEQTEVVPMTEFLQGALPRPNGDLVCPQLAASTFTLEGKMRERASVEQVQLWKPETVPVPGDENPDSRVVVVPDVSTAAGSGAGGHLLQVTRLDLSPDCEPGDIVLFASPDQP
ncbi:hypothetical protein [Actinoplanes sp. NPDC048796]|uniref:hypothetical protein n=1 Tax=Actinoplanes sp. NPDC048796 TaxID=3155640 RepID=UPI0033E1EC6E